MSVLEKDLQPVYEVIRESNFVIPFTVEVPATLYVFVVAILEALLGVVV